MSDSQYIDSVRERIRLEREARAKLIDDLASRIRLEPLTGAEMARLFDQVLARPTVSDPDVGSEHALDLACEALARRDYREALIQTARAYPRLSDFSRLADRLPADLGV